MELEQVIIRPLVTEKFARLAEHRQYAFAVRVDANKIQIREAVQRLFKVTVTAVRTSRLGGKRKRRGAWLIRRPETKRAIVTLAKGQQIDAVAAPAA